MVSKTPLRMLIINPNTTTEMTDALRPVVSSLGFEDVLYTFFTCPSTTDVPGIPSINSPDNAAASAEACLPHLLPLLPKHDAFLVACYSEHPLVTHLKTWCDKLASAEVGAATDGVRRRRYVTGIFEASVATATILIGGTQGQTGFGIVSTGKVWETALADAVARMLGGQSKIFLGCETTGLNADQLHRLPAAEVRGKMMDATKLLVQEGRHKETVLGVVCLGCAGMVGLEEAVRQAVTDSMGEVEGRKVSIVDGVKVGVGQLIALAKCTT